MKVPLLDLRRQNGPLQQELLDAFQRVLDSGQYILGKEVEELERRGAAVSGTRHAIGVSSGTDAILLALMSLGVGPGDEVICPSFTFFATAGCIARTGARPVFADSCPICCNVDVASMERLITPRTKALMPVHLFGQSADMDAVITLAGKNGLAVIEDAAQALGAAHRGRPVGSIGTFGTFSFFPSKNLGGFGDSGLLTTNDDSLAEKARVLRGHGAKPKYFHKMVGGNFRMDPLQAALLGVKLPHLDDYGRKRSENARHYNSQLGQVEGAVANCAANGGCGGDANLAELRQRGALLLLPVPHEGRRHIWNQYTVRVVAGEKWNRQQSPRDALRSLLQERNIGSEIYYPLPMHLQECFASSGPHAAAPASEALAAQCLSIPVFPELTTAERGAVIEALTDFLRNNA
jgi:dTDP-4-amino-4,6-dideoxygalactose transaminase